MATQARGPIEAGLYHVTCRGAGPIAIFHDDEDRTRFCSLLIRGISRHRWRCLAFCLMTTHYHLLLEVEDDALQGGMELLNGDYATGFNRRHGRSGHLFGRRYGARRIETDGHFLATLRYIARNPVEAGLCADPCDWPWGSYRGCVELDHTFPFVDSSPFYGAFSPQRERAIELIRAFVGNTEDVAA